MNGEIKWGILRFNDMSTGGDEKLSEPFSLIYTARMLREDVKYLPCSPLVLAPCPSSNKFSNITELIT